MAAPTVRQWLLSRVRLAALVWVVAGAAALFGVDAMLDAGLTRKVAVPVVLVGFALAFAPVQARVACPACGFAFWNGARLSWRLGAPFARDTHCPQCKLALDAPLP
jgi:hypothetical protein